MKHHSYHIKISKHKSLYYQAWQPRQTPKAIICLVHGIGEHSTRYEHWAKRFVAQSYAVVSYDQQGHGLSSGKRGLISSYQHLMDDIDTILKKAEQQFPNIPLFLYGHSMGGGEVLHHALFRESNYQGIISTSPWIISQAAPPKTIISGIKLATKLFPSATVKTKFDSRQLSHDPQVAKNYDQDKLVHHKISFRLFTEAYEAGRKLLAAKNKLTKPLLLLHGTDDQITDPRASKIFSENNKEYTTFKQWHKARHELHNETCKNEVFEYIVNWIEKQQQK